MTAEEKYVGVFAEVLGVRPEGASGLCYQSVPAWDSARHMELVAAIESAFGVTLDPDDILDFSSFEGGRRILSERYGIAF